MFKMNRILYSVLTILFSFLLSPSFGQQTNIRDYVLFGGNAANSNGYLQLGSSSNIQSGSIGSYTLVNTTGNSVISANIYSGGKVTLASNNAVSGRITAANNQNLTGTIFSVNSNGTFNGNIDVNGNILINSGTVTGQVTHPAGTTYSGPFIGAREIIGQPSLPGLPSMPAILNFTAIPANTPAITSNANLNPGSINGEIRLSGNKTITFNGPGVYVVDKIFNTGGGTNNFVFDFQNQGGTFRLYIHGDAIVGKINVTAINGGDASRIFTEIHGDGSSDNGNALDISNGSSSNAATRWLGTVWAPNGGITIGSGTGNSNIFGALWSNKYVSIQSGVNITYEPYLDCTAPDVNAGPDKPLSFLNLTPLTATSSASGTTFSWTATNGGLISGSNTGATINVSAAGTYIVTASAPAGCSSNDTINVSARLSSIIGSELQSIYDNYSPNNPPSPFFVIQHDSIMIDVITKEGQYTTTLNLLTSPTYGLTNILSNGNSSYIITGLYPISKLPLLNLLGQYIVYVRPYYAAINQVGLVTSEGDGAMRSNLVRQGFNLGGEGIKVGVISNSYNTITAATTSPLITNTAAQDVANGDLPGVGNPNGYTTPVNVLQDYPYQSSDEGRGMLQIVHDIAPKAELYFRTGFISPGDFAQGITELKTAGCNVIVDDVTFITEPFLKDGVVANAVDAVAATGTSYFSAAGNFTNKSYENSFNATPSPAGVGVSAHNFGGGDRFQSVTLTPGNYTIVLQWLDDIYSLGQTSTGGTKNDLDLYLTPNTDGTALFGFNRNNTNGDPIEILPFTLNSTITTNVFITNNTAGSNPSRFKYIIFRGSVVFNEYATGNSTIVGQANANGAIAIGAMRYDKVAPLAVESFSSYGGTTIGGVVRQKPDFTATDGVNTTVNLGPDYPAGSPDGYSNFFGTSAAAPHAAAVAALIMEGRKKYALQPTTSATELRTIFKNSAVDMYTPGFDFTSGNGFINADFAMRTFATPKPTLVQLNVPANTTPGTQSFTLTVTGQNFSPTSVIKFRDISLATTYISSTSSTAVVPVYTGNPPISVYTPPISTSGLDGGTSDSLYFNAPIKKNVIVVADNKTKKYGQDLESLTTTITIDGIPIQNTTFTLTQLGLNTMTVATLATASSNIGSYLITPTRVFDPNNATDYGLLELYNYTLTPGTYTIQKLPVTVTANNQTVVYGAKIPNISFTYQFDVNRIASPSAFMNSLESTHQAQLAKDGSGKDVLGLVNGQAVTIVNGQAIPIVNGQAVTIVNGQMIALMADGSAVPIVNGQSLSIVDGQAVPIVNNLSASQVNGLSFVASEPTLLNSREITNKTLVGGSYVTSTSKVVDITQESILDFNVNSAQTSMLSALPNVIAKGIVDIETYKDGQAVTIVNTISFDGQAVPIVNGAALSLGDGQAVPIVNGETVQVIDGQAVTIVNGDTIQIVSSTGKNAIILSQNEISTGLSPYKSINMITGLDVGQQYIMPGTLTNSNLELTNIPGIITITKAPVTITPTAGQNKELGAQEPILTYTNNAGLSTTELTGTLGRTAGENAGTYPYNLGTLTAGNNYTLTLAAGQLFTINKKQVIITPTAGQTKVYGDAEPVFTFTNNGGLTSFTGALGRTTGENAGSYPYNIGNLSAGANYNLTLATPPGSFTITKAPLVVTANDDYTFEGTNNLPNFTSQLETLKNNDANPGVTYTLSPTYTGEPGVYTITPLLNNFANAVNYNISYVTGNFYVNPKSKNAKKLRAYLDCIVEVTPPGAGFPYIAHFYAVNDNSTPIYVPIGVNNKLTGTSFDGSGQKIVFMPGNTFFDVPFDGLNLKWELTTYESTHKSSTSTNASSGSNKCTYATTTAVQTQSNAKGNVVSDDNLTPREIVPGKNVHVYPNPVYNKATIYLDGQVVDGRELKLYDAFGKMVNIRSIRIVSGHSAEIDMSNLTQGIYFLKIRMNNEYKTISILKQ